MRYFHNPLRVPWSLAPICRGSSSLTTRSWRNFRIRRSTGLSSFSSSFRAAGSNSIFQAIAPHYFVEGDRLGAPRADGRQTLLGEVDVFQILQMLENRFASVVGLGAPRALGETVEAFFDGFG